MTETDLPLTETVFYILLALHRPLHGYGITQEVEAMTEGHVSLGAGTLYGALKTLQKKGWIRLCHADTGGRGKKEYLITAEGQAVFRADVARMKTAVANAERMKPNA